jgi:hypothetical protein
VGNVKGAVGPSFGLAVEQKVYIVGRRIIELRLPLAALAPYTIVKFFAKNVTKKPKVMADR